MTRFLLTVSFVILTLLSWVLLLRDEQAITALGDFSLHLGTTLTSFRQTLLHYGLNSLVSLLFAMCVIIAFGAYFQALRQKISLNQALLFRNQVVQRRRYFDDIRRGDHPCNAFSLNHD